MIAVYHVYLVEKLKNNAINGYLIFVKITIFHNKIPYAFQQSGFSINIFISKNVEFGKNINIKNYTTRSGR